MRWPHPTPRAPIALPRSQGEAVETRSLFHHVRPQQTGGGNGPSPLSFTRKSYEHRITRVVAPGLAQQLAAAPGLEYPDGCVYLTWEIRHNDPESWCDRIFITARRAAVKPTDAPCQEPADLVGDILSLLPAELKSTLTNWEPNVGTWSRSRAWGYFDLTNQTFTHQAVGILRPFSQARTYRSTVRGLSTATVRSQGSNATPKSMDLSTEAANLLSQFTNFYLQGSNSVTHERIR